MPSSATIYRLRGGEINPALASCTGTGVPDYFYIQTFGAEKIIVDFDDAKITLLRSSDMQGQKPSPIAQYPLGIEDPAYIATTYSSASYSSRPLRTTDGDLVWTAQETHVAEWVNEEDIGL